MNGNGKLQRLGSTIAIAQRSQHITLGSDAKTCTAALQSFDTNLLPQVALHAANILLLGVGLNLRDNRLNLLDFEIDYVVHNSHCAVNMGLEQLEIERCTRCKRLFYIAVKVERNQTTTIVGAQRNFATRIGRDGRKAVIGIAIGHRLTGNGIPEQHTRLGRLPSIMDNLIPQSLCIDILLVHRFRAFDGELLVIWGAILDTLHKLVVNLDRYIGARNLACLDFGVNETFGIGVFNRKRQHKRTTTAILRNLTGRVGVTLHKRNDTCRSESAIKYGAACRTKVRQVVTHATTTFHKLHLLLVNTDNTTIGVGRGAVTDNKAVRQRGNLQIVTDTRHRASLRNNIAETIEQSINLIGTHSVGVAALDARNLIGDTLVHLYGRVLVNAAKRIFQSILAEPYGCSKFIATKVLSCRCKGLFVGVLLHFGRSFFVIRHSFMLFNYLSNNYRRHMCEIIAHMHYKITP